MRRIPLRALPNQQCNVVLGGQNCQIDVYQKSTGLFLDLRVNNVPVALAVLCHDRVRLVRESYSGFNGDLCFMDTMGNEDPSFEGLGTKFLLIYLEAADL
ncbi:hypothetical protein LWS69_01285 [Bordetella hinzii]|nr:hypothetical protein [Bordetella hinzii]